MGFSIKSIGNFVSDNIKSAIGDSANIVQQYVNNPITGAVASTALASIGVPPQVYGAIKNLQNSGLNSLQGIKQASAGGEYSQEIQSLTQEQFEEITRKIKEEKIELQRLEEEKQRQEEEERKKSNIRLKLYIISGGVILIGVTSFIAYKVLKKK
jgi:hypothetical protein